MKIEKLTFVIALDKIRIRYTCEKGNVISDWDKKEFQSKVDSIGWRKWDMELVQAGKVTGRTYGRMSWEEYYDFLTTVDIELFVTTFENIRRRDAKDSDGNDAG